MKSSARNYRQIIIQLAVVGIVSLGICFLKPKTVQASSDRAYQDYLFQSDQYRQKNNDFTVAKNEYLKFKTLASESTAVVKARDMLAQRSLLLRAYLLLLKEKIDESPTMSSSDRQLYLELITNEVAFLETHSKFVESVGSIADASKASEQLEFHYSVLALSIRQIILGLTTARLTELGDAYSGIMINSQILLNVAKQELPLDRQITLDRWFQKISDKRTLFLQHVDTINQANKALKGSNMQDIQTKFLEALPYAVQAKQDLTEGTSYLGELLNAMRYRD